MESNKVTDKFSWLAILFLITVAPGIAVSDDKNTPQLSEEQIQAYKDLFKQDAQDVLATMDRWAKSWVYQRIDSYLDCYSPDYRARGFASHDAWAQNRRQRFLSQDNIELAISNMQVLSTGQNEFTIRFEQSYRSDNYSDKTLKEVILHKIDDNWLITSENVLKQL
jgi:hypothetical protein